jgi:nucleotide-binding universal stress UspA family protein
MAFLRGHHLVAQAHALDTAAAPAQVLLEQVRELEAGLLVMGASGRSSVREFFGTSLTRTMLEQSPVPLFLYH